MTRKPIHLPAGVMFVALALGVCFAAAPDRLRAADRPGTEPASEQTPEWPAVADAVFALRNAGLAAPFTAFDARGGDLLVLPCQSRGRAFLGRFFDLVCDGGSFIAEDAGTWIGKQVAESGEFTVELTVTPAASQPPAPGVVLAYGSDEQADFTLLQDKTGLAMRLGQTAPTHLFAVEAGKTAHVLIACGKKRWAAYLDGRAVRSGPMPTDAAAWEAGELVLGANVSGADPWRGRIEAVALFPRALTAAEAAKQHAAARALRAGRKPARAVRFRGTLVRQAETAALEAIRPYTRSMTAAEYKVDEVLEGEWDEPTITVLHWMIMEGKRLPMADREMGARVELEVESLDDHPQLETARRDEMIDGEIALDMFYRESESRP